MLVACDLVVKVGQAIPQTPEGVEVGWNRSRAGLDAFASRDLAGPVAAARRRELLAFRPLPQ